MKNSESQDKFIEKITKGLEKSYQDLLVYKRQKKSVIVVADGAKIVKIKP
ncbi:MAG: hypothetical protein LCH67_14510 [Bacteroidetes bacterium]|nr:hypothetical protein [Bacteroidota bacterium]